MWPQGLPICHVHTVSKYAGKAWWTKRDRGGIWSLISLKGHMSLPVLGLHQLPPHLTDASPQRDSWVRTQSLELSHTGYSPLRPLCFFPRNVVWRCHPSPLVITVQTAILFVVLWLVERCNQKRTEQGHPALSSGTSCRHIPSESTSSPNTSNALTCFTCSYCLVHVFA